MSRYMVPTHVALGSVTFLVHPVHPPLCYRMKQPHLDPFATQVQWKCRQLVKFYTCLSLFIWENCIHCRNVCWPPSTWRNRQPMHRRISWSIRRPHLWTRANCVVNSSHSGPNGIAQMGWSTLLPSHHSQNTRAPLKLAVLPFLCIIVYASANEHKSHWNSCVVFDSKCQMSLDCQSRAMCARECVQCQTVWIKVTSSPRITLSCFTIDTVSPL